MNLKNILSKEPVAISSAVVAVLNVLVLLGVIDLAAAAVAGVNVAVVAVLGLFVRSAVTPNSNVPSE